MESLSIASQEFHFFAAVEKIDARESITHREISINLSVQIYPKDPQSTGRCSFSIDVTHTSCQTLTIRRERHRTNYFTMHAKSQNALQYSDTEPQVCSTETVRHRDRETEIQRYSETGRQREA